MANHKSSLKRIRQDKVKALHNKYYAKTMRNAQNKKRSLRLSARTQDFHSCKRGSIPLETTN